MYPISSMFIPCLIDNPLLFSQRIWYLKAIQYLFLAYLLQKEFIWHIFEFVVRNHYKWYFSTLIVFLYFRELWLAIFYLNSIVFESAGLLLLERDIQLKNLKIDNSILLQMIFHLWKSFLSYFYLFIQARSQIILWIEICGFILSRRLRSSLNLSGTCDLTRSELHLIKTLKLFFWKKNLWRKNEMKTKKLVF